MVSARFEFVGPVSTQVCLTIDGTGDAELPCPEAGADDFDCFPKKTGVKCQVMKSGWDLEAAVAAKSSGMDGLDSRPMMSLLDLFCRPGGNPGRPFADP